MSERSEAEVHESYLLGYRLAQDDVVLEAAVSLRELARPKEVEEVPKEIGRKWIGEEVMKWMKLEGDEMLVAIKKLTSEEVKKIREEMRDE